MWLAHYGVVVFEADWLSFPVITVKESEARVGAQRAQLVWATRAHY